MVSPVNAQQLRADLKEYVVEILFHKMDGSLRLLKGTLIPKYLPEAYTKVDDLKKPTVERENPNLVVLWDVDNNGWRSFHVDQVVSAQIILG